MKGFKQAFLSLVLVVSVAWTLGGCVSRSKYEELQQQQAELLQEIKVLREERATLEATLSSREMKSIGALEDRLRDCEKRVGETKEACVALTAEARKAGYYQGAADFNASLQVVGLPRSDGWWVFASHYYEFQVRLRDEALFSVMIETEDKQPPLHQSLALVSELTRVMRFGDL
jgi:hypothetical protein